MLDVACYCFYLRERVSLSGLSQAADVGGSTIRSLLESGGLW